MQLGWCVRPQFLRMQLAIRLAQMQRRGTPVHGFGAVEARALHAQRVENRLFQVGAQLLAGDRFNDDPRPVDAGGILPARAGFKDQRQVQLWIVRIDIAVGAGCFHVAIHRLAPHEYVHAAGVGQQVADGDRLGRRAKLRLAVGVEAGQQLQIGQRRQQLPGGLVHGGLALLDQLHHADTGDRLGHGGDPEHRVFRHRLAAADAALTEDAVIEHGAVSPGGERNGACDLARIDGSLELGVKKSGGRHGAFLKAWLVADTRAALPVEIKLLDLWALSPLP